MTSAPNVETIKEMFNEPGLERFLKRLRKKWIGRGSSGRIQLEKLTLEESEAVSRLLGTYYRPGTTAAVSLKELEETLQNSDLKCSLSQLFEVLEGKPLLLRKEKLKGNEAAWRALIQQAIMRSGLAAGAEPYRNIREWAAGLEVGGGVAGVRTLRKLADTNWQSAVEGLTVCFATLMLLVDRLRTPSLEFIRLPVLAAKQTGDAHAFDFSEPIGKLLWYGMVAIGVERTEVSEEAEELEASVGSLISAGSLLRREVYRRNGVADDDISSQVIVYAPSWFGGAEERVFTLRQVDRRQQIPRCSAVFAVENPSVFATLVERTSAQLERMGANALQRAELPMLICINGHPSAAVIRWLDRCLIASGGDDPPSFYYAGDYDMKGLEIAAGLRRRYPRSYISWRMSVEDYSPYAVMGLPLTYDEKQRMLRMVGQGDTELIYIMLERGVKVYQELLLDQLHMDWIEAIERMLEL